MRKIGVITEIIGEFATVMVGSSQTCGNCGCGALTRKNGELCDEHRFIKVKNEIGAKVGDPVNIEFQTIKMLKTTLLLYFIPLIMLLIGIFIGNSIQGIKPNDLISFSIGLIFLLISFILLNYIDKKKNDEELITISKFKGL